MFKTRLDKLGTVLGVFWHFIDSTHHGTLGKKIFRKNYPKTCSKHVWALLGTILGERLWAFLEFWLFLILFKNISKTRPSMEHWAKNIFGIWKIFWIYQKLFEDSTHHGTLGKKIFRKNYPKTCSKHVWALLGTILGIYGILKIFWFIKIISKTRPSLEHWAKNVSKKLPQNMFKTRLDKLGTFLGVFWILKIF